MKYLFVLNDPPYGTERTYNGLRLANNLVNKDEAAEILIFLMGDAVSGGKSGQKTPNGYYNVERMLKLQITRGGTVLLCGTCMDARALQESELLQGVRRSTLDELTELTIQADKVLVF